MMKNLRVVAVGLFVLSAGCGGGSGSSPTAPPPAAAVDLTGTWGESTGGDITWQLTQTGTTVSGTGRFSETNGPLGAISGQGVVSGTVSNGTFTFTDNESNLSRPNCAVVATGTLTINGTSQMTGRYTAVYTCNGSTAGTGSGTVTMQKR